MSVLADNAQQLPSGGYVALAGLVLLGSVVPVVPTGVLVSAATAVAMQGGASLTTIIVVSTVTAALGDIITLAVSRFVGDRALRWFDRRTPTREKRSRIEQAEERLRKHRNAVLITARLIPAGRIPVLLAAALTTMSWRELVPPQILAAFVWAIVYAAIGILGGALFDDVWISVLAAVVLVLAITGLIHLLGRLRRKLLRWRIKRRRARRAADSK